MNIFFRISILFLVALPTEIQAQGTWSIEKANTWSAHGGWLTGCNFIPSTAVNQLEMWQELTFDTTTLNKELGYAEKIGLTIMRVFLHHVAWQEDPNGFVGRMRQYLAISNRHHIKTMFVFFDDCWNDLYAPGTQPALIPSVHNSQWLKDPGSRIDDVPALMDTLEMYVKEVLTKFKDDERVAIWDLYNEPGHFGHKEKSWPLLKNVVRWAREINPCQPITIGVWNQSFDKFNQYQIANSDIISFHNYRDTVSLIAAIDSLKRFGRPVICTEYMKRPNGSLFSTHLPIFKREHVGAINWGLVAGKSQTNFPQGNKGGEPEPSLWYHDIFRQDGSPFNSKETDLIKELNKPVGTDGAYIIYARNHGVSYSLIHNRVTIDSFKLKNRRRQQITILPAQYPVNFSLKLHTKEVNQPYQYPSPSKLLVVSDIEGEFSAFVKLMTACKVMDSGYSWTFGPGHLVICGDLFDRGNDVTAYLWLLYRLEKQAQKAGGYVHVILGNHDIMNLSGDYRYVDCKYFTVARTLQIPYKELYAANTELGRWLRSKNIVEKIGDILFMHAGISQEVNSKKMSLEAINNLCRPFYDQPRQAIPDSLQIFFGPQSPFWYRGYFTGNIPESQIDETLALYGCRQVVVGHTIVDNIQKLYKGRVVGVDVNHHQGNHQALLIENGQYFRLNDLGERETL
ncbi:metallophosphoesterase [Chitinophaga ginsengisoli]|uniref:Cellulase (Glycosyl hydrolase family 5) n=1 Tax=Chitinophaga ginsengisoli TaxID=363837 RepID=A0A2P8G2B6_9BACT|nr:metallophosphoesterase [Chitinophaga ginsengisoli]PSL28097.1 cellulase (glycosyl hydrolase family 5) [Chitinophaga ginsengisoli]